MAPRKILENFGYDLSIFSQRQIDSMVQSIKNRLKVGMYSDKQKTEDEEKKTDCVYQKVFL